MLWKEGSTTPSWAGNFSLSSDPFLRGYHYLNAIRQLTLAPGMVDVTDDLSEFEGICTWIGNYIDAVNQELNRCLEACHGCFSSSMRRSIGIFATPLANKFGIDGLCNLGVSPVVILIDVGRTAPQDWLKIVIHEYAHAHLGYPGHGQQFFEIIVHLCLGLGLQPPRPQLDMEISLQNWPHCEIKKNPLAFWMGCL
ncbi:hypothetical protein [Lyngbya aestuarii]|uniref:hypothetical protein n=1 Tax=Lyngbya aestuarii TaxID=118322 RepID=UPI00403DEBDE